MKMKRLLYNRLVIHRVLSLFDYFVFYLLYAGNFIFNLLEWFYVKLYNLLIRHRTNDILSTIKNKFDWENCSIISRNRLYPHVPWKGISNKENSIKYWSIPLSDDSLKSQLKYQTKLFYLSNKEGIENNIEWKFILMGNPENKPLDFLDSKTNDSWKNISVPSHWQLQGYDIPIYTNSTYPFPCDPPFARRTGHYCMTACDESTVSGQESLSTYTQLHPKELGYNTTGFYKCKFHLPIDWLDNIENKKLFITFDGVDSCLSIWLNGEYVGYGQDFACPNEFEITDIILSNNNDNIHTLSVQVSRWSDGSYLEDQDKWWLSGIYRDVYITIKPKSFIYDILIQSELSTDNNVFGISIDVLLEDFDSTKFEVITEVVNIESNNTIVNLHTCNIESASSNNNILNNLTNEDIKDVYSAEINMRYPKNVSKCQLNGKIQDPILWSAERPYLYIFITSVYDKLTHNLIDVESCRYGFRTVKISSSKNNTLCVNNETLTIAGINRTEFDPMLGRVMQEKTMLTDLKLIKQFNFNSCRSAHYPTNPRWLDICDESGLYLVDEANIETHGFQLLGQPVAYLSNQKQWESAMMSRLFRMVERDKNHCSIIIWSLGNESGAGFIHIKMSNLLRKRDPSRYIQYESGGARSAATDIICPMYQRPKWCREQAVNDSKKRPVILCEYAHAMNNSCGVLKKYWDDFRNDSYPRLQGGFIWDMVDQGLIMNPNYVDDNEIIKYGYGGDFGDIPNSKQFCCNGIFGADRFPHPSAYEAKSFQSPVTIYIIKSNNEELLYIKNHNLFSSLDHYNIIVTISTDTFESSSFKLPIAIQPFKSVKIPVTDLVNISNTKFEDKLNISINDLVNSTEIWIDVNIVVNIETFAVPLGHSIIKKSLIADTLSKLLKQSQKIVKNPKIYKVNYNLAPNNQIFHVSWTNNSKLEINLKNGLISKWVSKDSLPIIIDPISLCIDRANTDNDSGGMMLSFSSRWKASGIDCYVTKPMTVKLEKYNYDLSSNSLHVIVSVILYPKQKVEVPFELPVTYEYLFNSDGSINISISIKKPYNFPPLPRFGLRFSIPSTHDNVKWFGLGPYESYPDRTNCCRLGKFESKVNDLHTPYIVPQENGRRSEPRWISFEDNNNKLLVIPNVTLKQSAFDLEPRDLTNWGFNASYYSLEHLRETSHNHDLTPSKDNRIFVHIDSKTMGVGGYDSWFRNIDEEYVIDNYGSLSMSVLIRPLDKDDEIQSTYVKIIQN